MAPEVYFMRFVYQDVSAVNTDDNVYYRQSERTCKENPSVNERFQDYLEPVKEKIVDYDMNMIESHTGSLKHTGIEPESNTVTGSKTGNNGYQKDKKGADFIILKKYACKYCSHSSNKRDNLRRHEKMHTGEKPFACNYCEKTFTRRDNWKLHERTHMK